MQDTFSVKVDDAPDDDEDVLEEVYGVERNEPCVHGHFDCATVEGGPCANETYARKLAAKEAS